MPESRASDAIDAGTDIAVAAGGGYAVVMDANIADRAVKWILQNNSDTDITIRLGSDAGVGVVLKAGGGLWYEESYAGVVYAKHGGAGSKNLTRVIF